tara:strand:- start:100 stop:621 length:522 start_codon:yes stop_codon:yes gene_type:complete
MGQEYFINSEELESKIRQLLPSQGGAGAGFDLSASTQIIPIIDLTESAEGSNVRADLQTAYSFDKSSEVSCTNATVTVANSPGYYRLNVFMNGIGSASGNNEVFVFLNDGASSKFGQGLIIPAGTGVQQTMNLDCIYYLTAGDTLQMISNNGNTRAVGFVRQIADIDGNLISP